MAGAGCATMAWLGLYGFAWNDYDTEARGAFEALTHGHLLEFLRLAPAYGGTLVERAPFALLPGLWGGGQLAVYRMVAAPCLLASAALAVWLLARMRVQGSSRLARGLTLGVCVANPLTLRALELGHPEELLGGCLCVAAVLLASGRSVGRRRALWSGAALGLAIANKEWALLAIGPVLLALPPGRRRWCLISAAAVSAAVLGPLALVGSSGFLASTRAVASAPSAIFQPWQVWWFFGHHGPLVHGLFGAVKPGYRTPPAWTGQISHPLILLVGLLLPMAVWLKRREPRRSSPPRRRRGSWPGARRCSRFRCFCCCAACSIPGTPSTIRSRSCSLCSRGRLSARASACRCWRSRAACSRGSVSSGCPRTPPPTLRPGSSWRGRCHWRLCCARSCSGRSDSTGTGAPGSFGPPAVRR